MATHLGVLPVGILETLSRTLNQDSDGATHNGTFLRLPHPRTGIPSLFLPSPRTSEAGIDAILEVQAVAPPNPRSWFIGETEVVADGKLLLMTPIDPAFLLLPILQAVQPKDGTLGSFRPVDDIFEEAVAKLTQSQDVSITQSDPSTLISEKDILYLANIECVRRALRRICEFKHITDELVVYRYSHTKVVEYLRGKVTRLMKPEVLERSRTLIRNLAKDGLMEDGKEELLEAGRIRAACELVAQYIPASTLSDLLSCYDFTSLDNHFKKLQDEAASALATASLNNSKKVLDTEDKKRKIAVKGSQGVEKLKKVNTNGMSKISSYFGKVGV